MQVKLNNITGIASPKVEYFDLHEEFGVTCLVEAGERVTLYFNKIARRSWLKQEHPNIVNIKWFNINTAILYYDEIGVAIVSMESWNNIRLGAVDKLFVSNSYIFVSYHEESYFRSWASELESNILSVFSREGLLEFGLRELWDNDRDADELYEIVAAYTYADDIVLIGFDSQFVWTLDISQCSWKKASFPFDIVGIEVLTGDDKTTCAIFDHRRMLNVHPDLPPFELAVFDLVSETSAKHDFAPVEAALIAAGFDMSEIKFQPSSTGKIIVSDGKKAALLEFSG